VPDPAPGPLRLVQSFVNTLSAEPDADLLATREEAAAWLRAAELLPAESGLSGSEHAALLRHREDIDFAPFTTHQAVSAGITSKGDHTDGRAR
jgi:hypothetical protein